jgi:TBC1 domain family member 20
VINEDAAVQQSKTALEVEALLTQQPVDLQELRQLSHKPGGFQNSRLRVRVWPKLMGINRYQISDYRQYIDPHRDDGQVRCDVERSLWNNHESCAHWTDEYRESRRKSLSEIMMAVLSRNPQLYYYQGYHDLVSTIMLLFEEDHLAFAVVEFISQHFIVDYMREDFSVISKFMHFFFVIIKAVDRELFDHMQAARLEPFFATSWLITWFAHDLHNLHDVARLFDVLLSSHPVYCYYVAAAVS